MILGHAHPAVVEAVREAAGRRAVVRRADARARSSWPRRSSAGSPPVEQVRLVNSGTEATMSAIRLARGFTGRTEDRQVRRLLPRPRRRAARRGRLRRRHARPADHAPASPARRPPTRSCCPTTTSTPCARRSPSTAPDRLRDHRGGRGQHGRGRAARPASTPALREICRRARRAADHRRGDDRASACQPRRLVRHRRRRRRPLHVRQGDVRRAARGGVRRPRRA